MKSLFNSTFINDPARLSFPYKGGVYFFMSTQIIRLEADSNYTHIFFNNHKPIMMAKVLCDYQRLLEPLGFIRTHRSHLINKQHISSVHQNGDIIMDDNSKAAISRSKRREVFNELKNEFQAA